MKPLRRLNIAVTIVSILTIYIALEGAVVHSMIFAGSEIFDKEITNNVRTVKPPLELGLFFLWLIFVACWGQRAETNLRAIGVQGLVEPDGSKITGWNVWERFPQEFTRLVNNVFRGTSALEGFQLNKVFLDIWESCFYYTAGAIVFQAFQLMYRHYWPLVSVVACLLTLVTATVTLYCVRKITKVQESERILRESQIAATGD